MYAKVEEGGLLNAVVSVAEIDVVEVDGEDFVFLEGFFDLSREHGFLEFTRHAFFGC